ncbi:MAG TPA: hypothetical protein VK927_11265, partial [Adhaeribacter sp.]|nr:hypothetical protein [Adhaeribacter sp.]
YINPEIADVTFCGTPYINNYVRPGLLIQAEAMFLPGKFAGLTAGAFANLTPKLPSAGLNLSLNLGMLK